MFSLSGRIFVLVIELQLVTGTHCAASWSLTVRHSFIHEITVGFDYLLLLTLNIVMTQIVLIWDLLLLRKTCFRWLQHNQKREFGILTYVSLSHTKNPFCSLCMCMSANVEGYWCHVDETSRPSTSSQKPAPLKGSMVTNQTKDLLISGVRKWGAGGESCAEGRAAGAKPRWQWLLPPPPSLHVLVFHNHTALKHLSLQASRCFLILSLSPSKINTHTRAHTHSHTQATLFMSLKISHTFFHRNKAPRTMGFSLSIIKLLCFQITSKSPESQWLK